MPVIPSEYEGSNKDMSEGRNDNDSELGVFAPLREHESETLRLPKNLPVRPPGEA
jgi:hypothetical protein